MSWVGWLVAGGLAWLVVAIVVSLTLGRRLRERQPQVRNVGHGHVNPRPDGLKARCGGPALCGQCRLEQDGYKLITTSTRVVWTKDAL